MTEENERSSTLGDLDPTVYLAGAIVFILLFVGALALIASGANGRATTATAGHHHMLASHLTPAAGPQVLDVAIGDYWFKPSSNRLRTGAYTFKAHNYGSIPHDVMIERTPIKMSAPGAPIDEAAPYGLDGMEPGLTKATKVMLTAGRWELFCSLPGHYVAGQREIITVYGPMSRNMPGMPSSRSTTGMPGSGMGMS